MRLDRRLTGRALGSYVRWVVSDADLLEWAWGILANVSGGNWARQSPDWISAVVRWRAEYFARVGVPESGALPALCGASESAGESRGGDLSKGLPVIPISPAASGVPRAVVECDDSCGAFEDPSTAVEFEAALVHEKNHHVLGGCSHGC